MGCINSYSVGSLTHSQRATSTLGNTGHKSWVSKCQVWRGTGRPAILYLLSRQCTGAYISRDMQREKRKPYQLDKLAPSITRPECQRIVQRTVKIKLQKKRVFQIKSRHDLVDNVLEIWTSLTPTYIKSLHVSLPKRI